MMMAGFFLLMFVDPTFSRHARESKRRDGKDAKKEGLNDGREMERKKD
jgi:hypothetical protein